MKTTFWHYVNLYKIFLIVKKFCRLARDGNSWKRELFKQLIAKIDLEIDAIFGF